MTFMRKLMLWIAGLSVILLIGLEIGARFLPTPPTGSAETAIQSFPEDERDEARRQFDAKKNVKRPPGLAMTALALVDALFFWMLLMLVTSTVMPAAAHNKLRAVLTPIWYLILLIVSLLVLFFAIQKMMLMISLILGAPFGPLVYLALFGFFGTEQVTVVSGLAVLLRAVGFLCLILASLRFLSNKTLMFVVGTGFLCSVLIGVVFGLLPGILHSVGDSVLAIIFSILALVWSLILLVRSIPPILSVLRV